MTKLNVLTLLLLACVSVTLANVGDCPATHPAHDECAGAPPRFDSVVHVVDLDGLLTDSGRSAGWSRIESELADLSLRAGYTLVMVLAEHDRDVDWRPSMPPPCTLPAWHQSLVCDDSSPCTPDDAIIEYQACMRPHEAAPRAAATVELYPPAAAAHVVPLFIFTRQARLRSGLIYHPQPLAKLDSIDIPVLAARLRKDDVLGVAGSLVRAIQLSLRQHEINQEREAAAEAARASAPTVVSGGGSSFFWNLAAITGVASILGSVF